MGLAALSLDALSSVAYGPEAIVIVLVAAGAAGLSYTLPVTVAIVVLLAVLVISYRQVIEAFPGGGGAYAVARTHLGVRPSLVAAASMMVDYVLNAAVGVSPTRAPRRSSGGAGRPGHPDVPLITLVSRHRALGPPIVDYLRDLERQGRDRRLVVLIPEVQPQHVWLRLLFNQRGTVLDRAIRQGTTNVVICRLRFRLAALATQAGDEPS